MTVTFPLTYECVLPKSGKASSAVVILHGFGDSGEGLIPLAYPLRDVLPDTVFFAPNGPNSTPFGVGLQWFSDNDWTFLDREGTGRAADLIGRFLTDVVEGEHGVSVERTVLAGFSQGCMTALFTAPRLKRQLAGLVGWSGMMVWDAELQGLRAGVDFQVPPVLLVHGEQDDVVPVAATVSTAERLENLGFADVETHVLPKLGHGIDDRALGLAAAFMERVLAHKEVSIVN